MLNKKVKKFFYRIFEILFLTFFIVVIVSFFSQFFWISELLSHFRLYYLLSSFIFVVVFLYKKDLFFAIFALVVLFVNFFEVTSVYILGSKYINDVNGTIKILVSNVLYINNDYDSFLDNVNKNNPDLIFVYETNKRWYENLNILKSEYKYSKLVDHQGAYGIGVYSKIKFESVNVVDYLGSGYNYYIPSLEVKYNIKGNRIKFMAIHPTIPLSKNGLKIRNKIFQGVIDRYRNTSYNLVVLGDFNISPYSYYFKKMLKELNLYDSRNGFGIHNSWKHLIPIDHVLVGEGLGVKDRYLSDSIGSDHQPVYIEIEY